MQVQTDIQSERLFLNSVGSEYTKQHYKLYLQKYLDICGYKDTTELLSRDHKQIERELIEVIITLKENGMKHEAIMNYIKPVITFCKISDIMINTRKVTRFMPPLVKSKKTFVYSREMIQKLLDIADERSRCIILILSSTGCRIGFLSSATVGSLEEVKGKDMYKITVYENEPEEYTVFCSSECKKSGIDPYLQMRRHFGEIITSASPLVREQFDKRDQFAIAHPRFVGEPAISRKLADLGEAAGIRTKVQLQEGQRPASQRKDIPICNGFRRYYCKTLLDSGLQTEKRWLLEGHNLKGNDSSYLKVTSDDLLEQYELAHDNLLISQEHILKRKVSSLQERNDRLDRVLDRVDKLEKELGII